MTRYERRKVQKAREGVGQTSVFLPPEVLAALRDVKEQTGITVAELIRRGVEIVLQQYGVEYVVETTVEKDGVLVPTLRPAVPILLKDADLV